MKTLRMEFSTGEDKNFVVSLPYAQDGLTAGAVATDGEMATRLGLASAPACAEAMAIAALPPSPDLDAGGH